MSKEKQASKIKEKQTSCINDVNLVSLSQRYPDTRVLLVTATENDKAIILVKKAFLRLFPIEAGFRLGRDFIEKSWGLEITKNSNINNTLEHRMMKVPLITLTTVAKQLKEAKEYITTKRRVIVNTITRSKEKYLYDFHILHTQDIDLPRISRECPEYSILTVHHKDHLWVLLSNEFITLCEQSNVKEVFLSPINGDWGFTGVRIDFQGDLVLTINEEAPKLLNHRVVHVQGDILNNTFYEEMFAVLKTYYEKIPVTITVQELG